MNTLPMNQGVTKEQYFGLLDRARKCQLKLQDLHQKLNRTVEFNMESITWKADFEITLVMLEGTKLGIKDAKALIPQALLKKWTKEYHN